MIASGMPTRILTRADVARLCTMEMALDAVEAAFAAHGRGETRMPVKVYLPLPEHAGDFRAMPSYMAGAAGVKWVNSHPQNPKRHGLPSVMGVYILSDPETATPLAVMDATLLTAFRTGAAAGVATKHLSRARRAASASSAAACRRATCYAAHRALLHAGFESRCADAHPRGGGTLRRRDRGARRLDRPRPPAATSCARRRRRARRSSARAAVRHGAHLNAMGADAPGKQELETALVTAARVFVDDLEQATESGEVNIPLHDGALTRAGLAGTLGDVVAGRTPARPGGAATITLFDSTGLAVQDLALARVLYAAALCEGVGREVDLV